MKTRHSRRKDTEAKDQKNQTSHTTGQEMVPPSYGLEFADSSAAISQLVSGHTSAALDATDAGINDRGLPDNLKAGAEELSGYSMDDVSVYYNSSEPAALNALAFTRGSNIHIAPGQEEHLPHEAWHVVQQKQGRVRASSTFQSAPINNDTALEAEATTMGNRIQSSLNTMPDISDLRQVSAKPLITQFQMMGLVVRTKGLMLHDEQSFENTQRIPEGTLVEIDEGKKHPEKNEYVFAQVTSALDPELMGKTGYINLEKIDYPNKELQLRGGNKFTKLPSDEHQSGVKQKDAEKLDQRARGQASASPSAAAKERAVGIGKSAAFLTLDMIEPGLGTAAGGLDASISIYQKAKNNAKDGGKEVGKQAVSFGAGFTPLIGPATGFIRDTAGLVQIAYLVGSGKWDKKQAKKVAESLRQLKHTKNMLEYYVYKADQIGDKEPPEQLQFTAKNVQEMIDDLEHYLQNDQGSRVGEQMPLLA